MILNDIVTTSRVIIASTTVIGVAALVSVKGLIDHLNAILVVVVKLKYVQMTNDRTHLHDCAVSVAVLIR